MGLDSSASSAQPSRHRKPRQQVAAVCYRLRKRGVQFLLVQTRGERWIFPKGGVEPGLTHAQSAALEAFEEAGVHGRMETISFAHYFRRKADTAIAKKKRANPRSTQPDLAVSAHLCEVTRLEPPQESNRNPTWFSAEKAKERLREGRAAEFGAELARVVERALTRIRRRHSGTGHTPDGRHKDALQRVRFEALEDGRFRADLMDAALARHFLGQRRAAARSSAAIEIAVQAHLRKYLQIAAPMEIRRPVLRLGVGGISVAEGSANITAIDSGRRASLPKPGGLPSAKSKVLGKLVGGRSEKS